MQLPHCPKCHSEYTYEDSGMFICPECAHEWNNAEPADDNDALIVKDANGNLLSDGDSITIIKDLKINCRDGHQAACLSNWLSADDTQPSNESHPHGQ